MNEHIPLLIAMLICVIGSAYFSATETAFSTLNKSRLKALAEKGSRKAALAMQLGENYDKLISTVLIGNNIVNIAVASMGTVLFIDLMGSGRGPLISAVVITAVVLVFGEVTPKNVAKDIPEQFAMFSAPLLQVMIWLLTPLNFVFSNWKKLIAKLFKLESDTAMSQEELLLLVDEVEQEGTIDEDEGELLRNAIEFGDLEAQDILTHRTDLEGFPIDADKEEIARAFTQSRYSRLLVYEETIDNIVGVVHQKDFYVNNGITPRPIAEIMAKPVFIYQSEKINDLLQLLQKRKSHVAVVVDEYGGTLGIVTMEDILEELVGEIWDEHDEVVETFKQLSTNRFLVDGLVSLDDFAEYFNIDCESDSVSLGGWVMERLSKVPSKDDNFCYENLRITVAELDALRVAAVNVEVLPRVEEPVES